jgi:hypothetical protein
MSTQLATVARPLPELAECEAIIERGLATFVEVGKALLRIRDDRLYRETHSTFADYCKQRWGMSKSHAYRQIEAAEVVDVLSGDGEGPKMSTRLGDVRHQIGDIPASESVARELRRWAECRSELGAAA